MIKFTIRNLDWESGRLDISPFVNVSYERLDVGKRLSSLHEWDRELMAKNFTTIFMEMIFWILCSCVQIYGNIFIYWKRYWEQGATYFQTHKRKFFFSIMGFVQRPSDIFQVLPKSFKHFLSKAHNVKYYNLHPFLGPKEIDVYEIDVFLTFIMSKKGRILYIK